MKYEITIKYLWFKYQYLKKRLTETDIEKQGTDFDISTSLVLYWWWDQSCD